MKPHLLIMAAGTGGHIMPGLAIAQEAKARGWAVSWLGTRTGMENRWVPQQSIPMHTIPFTGMRGKGLMHTLNGCWYFITGLISGARMIQKTQVDLVIGMGGYICVPGGMAAWLRGKPLMLVNADAALLVSNRLLRPLATGLAMGFEPSAGTLGLKEKVMGNPVRVAIEEIAPPAERFAHRAGPLRILVMGGSLGARIINQLLPQVLALLPAHARPYVLHQTGAGHEESVAADYSSCELLPWVKVQPFIEDVAQALTECDLVICRAGAITVSELCMAGVPSILIPLVLGTTSHQQHNALYMQQQGAAIHIEQKSTNVPALAQVIQTLDRETLLRMAERARALAKPKAAASIVNEMEKWLEHSL